MNISGIRFKIPVTCQIKGYVEVGAGSKEEAIKKASEPRLDRMKEASLIIDTWKLDTSPGKIKILSTTEDVEKEIMKDEIELEDKE